MNEKLDQIIALMEQAQALLADLPPGEEKMKLVSSIQHVINLCNQLKGEV